MDPPRAGAARHRRWNSPECTTLDAYRLRYGLYKSDPHLQAAHAVAPWVVTWDDHEVENNYAGIVPQDAVDAAGFAERRTGAYQAYWEHQPLRGDPANAPWQIDRSLTWGRLADLVVLDGRQYRSDQACGPTALGRDIGPACEARDDPGRTMLGAEQLAWLDDTLADAPGRWTLLANQTILTSMPLGTVFNQDQWDGYPLEQALVIDRLEAARNAVVLTGDLHAAWHRPGGRPGRRHRSGRHRVGRHVDLLGPPSPAIVTGPRSTHTRLRKAAERARPTSRGGGRSPRCRTRGRRS